jgi:hypothetical protein
MYFAVSAVLLDFGLMISCDLGLELPGDGDNKNKTLKRPVLI